MKSCVRFIFTSVRDSYNHAKTTSCEDHFRFGWSRSLLDHVLSTVPSTSRPFNNHLPTSGNNRPMPRCTPVEQPGRSNSEDSTVTGQQTGGLPFDFHSPCFMCYVIIAAVILMLFVYAFIYIVDTFIEYKKTK